MLGFDGIEQSEKKSRLEFRDAQGRSAQNSSIRTHRPHRLEERIFSPTSSALSRQTRGDAEADDPGATNLLYFLAANIARVPEYRDRALSGPISPRPMRERSRRFMRSAAATCRSTTSTLAFSATGNAAPKSPRGHDPDELLSDYIRAINIAVEHRPADLVVTCISAAAISAVPSARRAAMKHCRGVSQRGGDRRLLSGI